MSFSRLSMVRILRNSTSLLFNGSSSSSISAKSSMSHVGMSLVQKRSLHGKKPISKPAGLNFSHPSFSTSSEISEDKHRDKELPSTIESQDKIDQKDQTVSKYMPKEVIKKFVDEHITSWLKDNENVECEGDDRRVLEDKLDELDIIPSVSDISSRSVRKNWKTFLGWTLPKSKNQKR